MGGRRVAFITGAQGFVAGRLSAYLFGKGYEVIGLTRDATPTRLALDVRGDIRDQDLVYRVLVQYNVSHVYHLAAQALVTKALENPLETWDSNVHGTYSVLEACRRYGRAESILVQSSDKALGMAPLPYIEDSPLNGIFPYDASKAAAEIVARSYRATYKLPIVISRCSNIYGPGDENLSRIIPDTIVKTLEGKRVQIRSDGTPSRDYVYIDDVVAGLTTLSERAGEFVGEVFHFGSGLPVRVIDLVRHILSTMGRFSEPEILGTAKAEIDVQYMSVEKAKRLLDWTPKTSMDEGLRQTIEWWKHRLIVRVGGSYR